MDNFFHFVHVFICLVLVAVILFQEGKAGGLTSVSESSQSLFGARGAGTFLTKLTTVLVAVFMFSAIGLNLVKGDGSKSIADGFVPPTTQTDSTSLKAEEDAPATDAGEVTEGDGEAPATDAAATSEEATEEKSPSEDEENNPDGNQ